MKNRLKTALMLKLSGKKRYIAAALIAIELASLPAAAQIVHKVAFQVQPTVTAIEIPTSEAGISKFMVVSNAPFTVRSANMIGEIDVSVHKSGDINNNRFGDNAQMPGPKTNCANIISPAETVIYQADRKTALSRGTPVSQAVIIQIKHDPSAAPRITFAKDGTAPSAQAEPCNAAIS
ncbi:MAG: hypothetical protein ABJG88_02595 [Litorimonas sp.]